MAEKRKPLPSQNTPLNAIIVEKYDSVTGEALPGCTFQLRYLGDGHLAPVERLLARR